MDTSSAPVTPKKKRTNAILGVSIFVLLVGISVGMYLLNFPVNIFPRAAEDTFSRCGPSGQCNAYGWTANVGYKRVPDNCYIALYKCRVSQWDRALAVGCQKNTSNPSRDTAYYAEIHKKTASNPNPSIWDRVVAGTDGNGHLLSFYPPQECGIWQIDVGPPCNFSFHSYGNRRANICEANEFHNVCDGTACKRVPGAGSNDCSNPGNDPAPQCSHKKCENNKCVVVPGGNVDNKCTTDSDCLVTPTPTRTPTPTPTRSPTPTLPPGTTPTPTPTICPVPGAVSNVSISCPTCGGDQ